MPPTSFDTGRETTYAVGVDVTVYPGRLNMTTGRIVDDFGTFTPVPTEYNGQRIADPARRWAVIDKAGNLLFVDSTDLTPLHS